jgi:transposase
LLVECGWGAGRGRPTYLGAQYARLAHRRGKKKAALASGHSILIAAYHILRTAALTAISVPITSIAWPPTA